MAETPAEIAGKARLAAERVIKFCFGKEHERGPLISIPVRDDNIDLILCDCAAMIDRQAAEIERLRAGGCARDQTTTQYCAEAVGLRKENDALRALAASRGCVYGYQNPAGVCSLGYPGCACMDDLAATMEWSLEDDGRAATKRLLERAVTAEAEIERLRALTTWRPIAEALPGHEIVRWHKVWRCPVAVVANAGRIPEACEWITATRDQSWPEEAFTPHFVPTLPPPSSVEET